MEKGRLPCPSSVPQLNQMKSKKIINVAVAGCGYWGPNLIRNLNQANDCRLKVVCDLAESRLRHMKKLYPDIGTTTRFEDLLQDAELDAIAIATPVRFHFEMAKACLEAG